jgi:hypothetical protein
MRHTHPTGIRVAVSYQRTINGTEDFGSDSRRVSIRETAERCGPPLRAKSAEESCTMLAVYGVSKPLA